MSIATVGCHDIKGITILGNGEAIFPKLPCHFLIKYAHGLLLLQAYTLCFQPTVQSEQVFCFFNLENLLGQFIGDIPS